MYKLTIENFQDIGKVEIIIEQISIILGTKENINSTILKILYALVAAKINKIKIEEILEKEIESYTVKNGEIGEIKLYRRENLIYYIQIKLINGKIKVFEIENSLKLLAYKEVIYVNQNDVYALEGIWEEILILEKINPSLKDIILRIKKSKNIKSKNRLELIEYLITGLNESQKALLLIDEPSVGLHLNKVKEFVKILKRSKNIDIVFTTENSLLINYLISDSKIFVAEEQEGGINIKLTTNNEEILRPYIEPFTELRKLKFKNILE